MYDVYANELRSAHPSYARAVDELLKEQETITDSIVDINPDIHYSYIAFTTHENSPAEVANMLVDYFEFGNITSLGTSIDDWESPLPYFVRLSLAGQKFAVAMAVCGQFLNDWSGGGDSVIVTLEAAHEYQDLLEYVATLAKKADLQVTFSHNWPVEQDVK